MRPHVAACALAACFVAQTVQGARTAPEPPPLPRLLQPSSRGWAIDPGAMTGFWLWTGPDDARSQVRRTGANAASLHLPLHLQADTAVPQGVRPSPLPRALADNLAASGLAAGAGIGEHNNAWFVRYPPAFWDRVPGAAMQAVDGRRIEADGAPWPAMDDPDLQRLSQRSAAASVAALASLPGVRYWVVGGEQAFPDYFGLPAGDHRPGSMAHWRAWLAREGLPAATHPAGDAWLAFRESVCADRFALGAAFIHGLDPTRPALIPTHGNPFALDLRARMAYPHALMAAAGHGFEAGPIGIDDDPERTVRFTLDLQTGTGLPAAAPRLGSKQLDAGARGGGRTFSPRTLRRHVMEAVGLGVGHVGLVQWAGDLPDGEWGIAGTPAEAEARQMFARLRRARPWLQGTARLAPQVGLLVADATWRHAWQDRWTTLYDAACARGWCVRPVTDLEVDADTAQTMPVLVSVDNPRVCKRGRAGIQAYLRAGGTIVRVGALGATAWDGGPALPLGDARILNVPDAGPGSPVRVAHRTQTTTGATLWERKVRPLPLDALQAVLAGRADLWPARAMEGGRPAAGVETLTLTDGTSLAVALIERAGRARTVEVAASARVRARLGAWTAHDALDAKTVTTAPRGARLTLRAHEGALVVLAPRRAAADVRRAVLGAAAAVRRWSALGADVRHWQTVVAEAQKHHRTGRPGRAFALARQVLDGLGVRARAQAAGDGMEVRAQVWTPDGRPVRSGRVRARLAPSDGAWHAMTHAGKGNWRVVVAQPTFWDPSRAAYAPIDGRTAVLVEARTGHREGGARTSVR